ncbi:MAG: UDP-3-O-acyl-N-acetylglucosamine deacetylase [Myxococcota bacterium]|nr:UDP-3-O-acyl-N-acetylglucosamine deacetylase [Myxococcota bacterium]
MTPSRRRLRRSVRLRGHGLFRAGPASVTISPGREGAGWRWAAPGVPLLPLNPEHRIPRPRRSALRAGGEVQVCEHLLAALLLADIDDCDIRFHQPEAPILDGSARPWLRAFRLAGFSGRRREIRLRVGVSFEGSRVHWTGDTAPAAARTFLTAREGSALHKEGLFPGARPGCALVLDDGYRAARYGGRPRLPDEPAWHKLLDLLGDLGPWRARGRLEGELQVDRPGHEANGAVILSAFEAGRLAFLS